MPSEGAKSVKTVYKCTTFAVLVETLNFNYSETCMETIQ